ncbi:MAG TPA: hypothetical protein H9895_09205 [Candidatus Pseudogracilibacillus intestinigallinarum]|uniref:Uncharacterized protein n=1 Tax=Candidatus Pseudogracilibacillus intestinigallinarum TaxID=2838742 RepID=A0A9D1PMP2_9BACI|nr:hypothetical protein [Candidatus Pseudogracilibacillus intestinigallinarum]
MTLFTIFMSIAILFFIVVLVIKLNEKRYAVQKSEAVERFITYKNIHVTNLFSGAHFDIIHDEEQEMIWYTVFQRKKLQYKELPYHTIYQVVWNLDGTPIRTVTRNTPSKEALLTKENNIAGKTELKEVNAQYRVKEATLTITLDETTTQTIELPLFSSTLPKSFGEVEQSDIAIWYNLFVSIIQKEETNNASSR